MVDGVPDRERGKWGHGFCQYSSSLATGVLVPPTCHSVSSQELPGRSLACFLIQMKHLLIQEKGNAADAIPSGMIEWK